MFHIIGKPKAIGELPTVDPASLRNMRQSVPIMIIDDEGLAFETVLQRHEFHVTVVPDIEDIAAVERYPIVICDIRGVGAKFHSPREGAHVVEEIRKAYPMKYLIALTSQKWPASFQRSFALCDKTVGKDLTLDDWVRLLEEAIAMYLDPAGRWKKVRSFLMCNNVSIVQLLKLEDQYVRAMLSGKRPFQRGDQLLELLPSNAKDVLLAIGKDVLVKGIVEGTLTLLGK